MPASKEASALPSANNNGAVTTVVVQGGSRSLFKIAVTPPLGDSGLANQVVETATRDFTLSSMFQQISMVFGVALAAAILNVSQVVRGAPALELFDFRVGFFVVGALCLAASLQLLVLPRNAGAEVSGHQRPKAA